MYQRPFISIPISNTLTPHTPNQLMNFSETFVNFSSGKKLLFDSISWRISLTLSLQILPPWRQKKKLIPFPSLEIPSQGVTSCFDFLTKKWSIKWRDNPHSDKHVKCRNRARFASRYWESWLSVRISQSQCQSGLFKSHVNITISIKLSSVFRRSQCQNNHKLHEHAIVDYNWQWKSHPCSFHR